MSDEYTSIRIRVALHRQIKAWAALQGKTIMDFVEEACRAMMPPEPLLPFGRDDEKPQQGA